ncbi:hypothetical protein J2Z48_000643 [Croceifilum oryzae]|uniref:Uncharacterized protein n=1 Tax=Croceifilum oryzae TaxID=1553429 RepID=A0AAJ1TIA2_9BACL|nr:hypothetical protein [Croceifilum oryzae]MDQ0416479.1 hypothetical protein [Croceifilum oryzae]
MEEHEKYPNPILVIYGTVMPNRDIHLIKVVCDDGFEIHLSDMVLESDGNSSD